MKKRTVLNEDKLQVEHDKESILKQFEQFRSQATEKYLQFQQQISGEKDTR